MRGKHSAVSSHLPSSFGHSLSGALPACAEVATCEIVALASWRAADLRVQSIPLQNPELCSDPSTAPTARAVKQQCLLGQISPLPFLPSCSCFCPPFQRCFATQRCIINSMCQINEAGPYIPSSILTVRSLTAPALDALPPNTSLNYKFQRGNVATQAGAVGFPRASPPCFPRART